MSVYSDTLNSIRTARETRDQEKNALYSLRLEYLELQKKQKKFLSKDIPATRQSTAMGHATIAGQPTASGDQHGNQGGNQGGDQTRDQTGEIERVKKAMEAQRSRLMETEKGVLALVGILFTEQTPQQLIEEWDATMPILLLPLRLETKFKDTGQAVAAGQAATVNRASAGGRGTELWVRAYPDEIAIVTHEKVLTQQEIDYGKAYWKALWNAKNEDGQKKTAWRMLTDKFGANRSAWVALSTKPPNWTDATLLSADDLQFPVFTITKTDKWTEAPHTRVMPDRLVLMGYRNQQLQYTAVGKQITDILVLGPTPLNDGDKPSLSHDPVTKKLQFDDDFKWIADFELAVQNGMGFKIPMDAQALGFDQLLVIGIKLSANELDGKTLVENLLDNHHYSRDGLSLVTQGTPTNNTEEQDAGYSKKDPFQDISFFVETGQPLFQPVPSQNEATDGQRLADFLGLEYNVFQYVANSDARDHTEAVAMNKALYAATLGYYTHSMLNQVMDENTLNKLRYHFTNYVTGRGALAAIRVGSQPYGILLTSAFSKWNYDKARNSIVEASTGSIVPGDPFLPQIYRFLLYLQNSWSSVVPRLAHISKPGSASANLMEVLGLQPTAAEYFQRIGYSFDYLQNIDGFGFGGKYFWDVVKMAVEGMYVRQILAQFGYNNTDDSGNPKPIPLLMQLIFQHYHTQLDKANLIDNTVLSETKTIKPYATGGNLNYIDWLLKNAGDSTTLEKEDFGGAPKPNSLLYMMLKHSLLLDSSTSIHHFLQQNNILGEELIRSRKYMNMSSAPNPTHWEVFLAPVNRIVTTEASSRPIFEYIHSSRFAIPADREIVGNLDELKWAFKVLKDRPTAALERVFAEHMDTLTYRLDAWQTSLFHRRLEEQRGVISPTDKGRKKGIYIGAYGYLENVKPETTKRTKIADDVLPPALQEHEDNLYEESNNGGYVHASSLNHATAAAILRNGYLTHAIPGDSQRLSVNLSSERVRRAKYLVDGIRNGQTLEVLLGYQFERGFHEWSTRPVNPVILNHLIPDFRKAFPIKKTKVPQEGNTTGPEETIKDYHVVNGLDLARLDMPFPFGITGLPSLDTQQVAAIQAEKDNIANTLDALRDLLTSESAYQLALGNFERAAAVMQAVSDSHMPPDIEVIHSARGTELSFTNRVMIHFDSTLLNNPWPAIAFTQKAKVEPGMNQWVASLLGDPDKIRCWVKAVDKEGHILKRADNTDITGIVTLKDLQVQALDFMYLITSKLEASGASELEFRVRYFFAQKNILSDDTIVSIEFANTQAGADNTIKSFAEILPFADYVRKLACSSKTLAARDFQPASKQVSVLPDNPDNFNIADLQNRVQFVFGAFDSLFTQLDTAITDAAALKTEPATNTLRSKLKEIADAGCKYAFPQSAAGFAQQQIDTLVAQGQSQVNQFKAVKAKYTDNLAVVNKVDTAIGQKISLLTEMIKSMLGGDFVLLPRFGFNNVAEVSQAYASRGQLLQYASSLGMTLAVDEWGHGISLVRPKMHGFEMIRLLNDNFNAGLLTCEPIQLPYRDKDTWLAVEFPAGTSIDHDTLSIVQYNPQGFDATKDQCGLLIDEWTETIPHKEEVTGITFNYNQPNSFPPQAILLAMSPQEAGHWTWDDLVASVTDTFDRAKRRAVEPDMIDQQNGISTLIPALFSEFSTGKNNISLDLALNLSFVLEQVMALKIETL